MTRFLLSDCTPCNSSPLLQSSQLVAIVFHTGVACFSLQMLRQGAVVPCEFFGLPSANKSANHPQLGAMPQRRSMACSTGAMQATQTVRAAETVTFLHLIRFQHHHCHFAHCHCNPTALPTLQRSFQAGGQRRIAQATAA